MMSNQSELLKQDSELFSKNNFFEFPIDRKLYFQTYNFKYNLHFYDDFHMTNVIARSSSCLHSSSISRTRQQTLFKLGCFSGVVSSGLTGDVVDDCLETRKRLFNFVVSFTSGSSELLRERRVIIVKLAI